jgi:hypothetical protein
VVSYSWFYEEQHIVEAYTYNVIFMVFINKSLPTKQGLKFLLFLLKVFQREMLRK